MNTNIILEVYEELKKQRTATPGMIGEAIQRSTGAVLNALSILQKLEKCNFEIVQSKSRKRYFCSIKGGQNVA